jgi:hypothetical protein
MYYYQSNIYNFIKDKIYHYTDTAKTNAIVKQNKTLVIILAETRANELTFTNIKENLIDELNADLCLCIGVKEDYDYDNPFYKLAKYKFLYNEPVDYAIAFDYAYDHIINKSYFSWFQKFTFLCQLPWRKFLEIKDQFLGGIKDDKNEHPGSAGILIFYRWFLLQHLLENKLIDKYDRFIITRSDYIYTLPHPKIELLDKHNIWIPNCEYYGGVTDRHVVLSKKNIVSYLNILNNFVLKSHYYFRKLKNYNSWNLEQIIKFHLQQESMFNRVKFFPYVMYTVRSQNGTTRWSAGKFSKEHNYYIKYFTEYNIANYYKKNCVINITEFYKKEIDNINIINKTNFVTYFYNIIIVKIYDIALYFNYN